MSQSASDTESSWKTEFIRKAAVIPKDIIEFIFPRTCVISGERILSGNSNSYIDDSVLNLLERATAGDLHGLSCRLEADESLSVFRYYEDCELSKAIHLMKYRGFWKIGEMFGEILGRCLASETRFSNEKIIPVPLHRARLRERGYNQSIHISRGVSRVCGGNVYERAVIRTRNTETQTKLNREERTLNVDRAFDLNHRKSAEIRGGTFLIIDDIITTGATVNEITRLLKMHGAVRVVAASIAVAV